MAPNDQIAVVKADITTLRVDVIVNAANCGLSGGGGVDGAIHRAAGPQLVAACRQVGPCETGSARITPGFKLPAAHVVHAVGPVWYGGHKREAELLAGCHRTALELASSVGAKTVAFPAISCGAYRFPVDRAAAIAMETTADFLKGHPDLSVTFACFDAKTFRLFDRAWQALAASG